MAFIAVTYSFSNGSTSDATQVNSNFTDIINGLSDGTKDLSMNAATFAGNVTCNGNVVLGNASGDTISPGGTFIASVIPNAADTYDLGSTTLGWRAAYLFGNTKYLKLMASGSQSADWTFTFPTTAGTSGYFLKTNGSGVTSWSDNTRPTIQTFTSGSGTYTTPAGVKYIKIKMAGGGGGGGGGGTVNGTAGGNGGNTTFGTSLLTANGGSGSQIAPADGGSYTIASPAIGFGVIGQYGHNGSPNISAGTLTYPVGGAGGSTPLGGGGRGGLQGAVGLDAKANTGSGGGGGGASQVNGAYGGAGGGAGGYLEAIINDPSASYSYAVGAGGTAGGNGTSGNGGAAGAAGIIIVEEYYV